MSASRTMPADHVPEPLRRPFWTSGPSPSRKSTSSPDLTNASAPSLGAWRSESAPRSRCAPESSAGSSVRMAAPTGERACTSRSMAGFGGASARSPEGLITPVMVKRTRMGTPTTSADSEEDESAPTASPSVDEATATAAKAKSASRRLMRSEAAERSVSANTREMAKSNGNSAASLERMYSSEPQSPSARSWLTTALSAPTSVSVLETPANAIEMAPKEMSVIRSATEAGVIVVWRCSRARCAAGSLRSRWSSAPSGPPCAEAVRAARAWRVRRPTAFASARPRPRRGAGSGSRAGG
mmetsp:Transcript_39660/g.98152  ORF Transcript_39660/g.98152 Transcript_39660/m.98152 type:complete len:298 (-) Transcript_39660:145-1038(-)